MLGMRERLDLRLMLDRHGLGEVLRCLAKAYDSRENMARDAVYENPDAAPEIQAEWNENACRYNLTAGWLRKLSADVSTPEMKGNDP